MPRVSTSKLAVRDAPGASAPSVCSTCLVLPSTTVSRYAFTSLAARLPELLIATSMVTGPAAGFLRAALNVSPVTSDRASPQSALNFVQTTMRLAVASRIQASHSRRALSTRWAIICGRGAWALSSGRVTTTWTSRK